MKIPITTNMLPTQISPMLGFQHCLERCTHFNTLPHESGSQGTTRAQPPVSALVQGQDARHCPEPL